MWPPVEIDPLWSPVAGVDEVGRGPLAGPVTAAAVILDPDRPIKGLADSKVLTAARREALAVEIRETALAWCVAEASAGEIDRLNIHHATLLAMQRAVCGLATAPGGLLVDGRFCPAVAMPALAVVKGDSRVPAISAASILAKVARDAVLTALHTSYPVYNFASHKGYPTPEHLAALRVHGPTPEHRRSFSPLKNLELPL